MGLHNNMTTLQYFGRSPPRIAVPSEIENRWPQSHPDLRPAWLVDVVPLQLRASDVSPSQQEFVALSSY